MFVGIAWAEDGPCFSFSLFSVFYIVGIDFVIGTLRARFILTIMSYDIQEDMSRAEDLTTKFRTLSYDHERLMGMYRSATEKSANAEREMNLHKSKLAYVPLSPSLLISFPPPPSFIPLLSDSLS